MWEIKDKKMRTARFSCDFCTILSFELYMTQLGIFSTSLVSLEYLTVMFAKVCVIDVVQELAWAGVT